MTALGWFYVVFGALLVGAIVWLCKPSDTLYRDDEEVG